MTLAVTKILARDIVVEIQTNPVGPVYAEIGGLTSLSLSPTKNDADTTDFNSGGRLEHIVASRGMGITLEGQRLEDPATGSRDPGQEAVETLADAIGAASLGDFRITSPGGKTWTFKASADVTPMGGGNDDPSSWS